MTRSLRLELVQHELLAIELKRPSHACAVSGEHWLTVDGLDICLKAGEQTSIPAGKVLAEGNGMLEFTQQLEQVSGMFGWRLNRPAQCTMPIGKVCF